MSLNLSQDLKKQKSLFEILRFLVVGGAATVTDLAVTILLSYFTDFNENIITSSAFIIAFWVSYFGHRYFTFKKKGSVLAFFSLAVTTLILRNIIVFLLVRFVIDGLAALIIAMALVTVITFVIAKFKVFKG